MDTSRVVPKWDVSRKQQKKIRNSCDLSRSEMALLLITNGREYF